MLQEQGAPPSKITHRILALCGLIAPLLFVFTAILGGALRPGYSHISDTVSELFSPGSPNRLLLSALHTLFAVLLVLFGIGVLEFVRGSRSSTRTGTFGAWSFVAMGVVSISTATIFHQDAWGSAPTLFGEMHQILSGVISILSMLLLGIWSYRSGIFPRFRAYSFATVLAVLLAAGLFIASFGGPMMGLTERLAILVGFQWTFTLAALILARG